MNLFISTSSNLCINRISSHLVNDNFDYNNNVFLGNMKLYYTIMLYLITFIYFGLLWFSSCEMNPCIYACQVLLELAHLDVHSGATTNSKFISKAKYTIKSGIFFIYCQFVHLFFQFRK